MQDKTFVIRGRYLERLTDDIPEYDEVPTLQIEEVSMSTETLVNEAYDTAH